MALTVLTRDCLITVVIEILLPVGKLPLMICSKQAVSCHVCFNFSRLNSRLPVLHSGNSPSRSPTKCMSSIFVILKFKRAYFKFPVSGRSKHRYTHACTMKLRHALVVRCAEVYIRLGHKVLLYN